MLTISVLLKGRVRSVCCYANTVSERHKLQTRKENPQKVTSKASTDLPHQQSFLVHSWASFWDEIPSRQSSTGRKSAQPISLQTQSRDIPIITMNTINDVRFLLTVLSTGWAKVCGRAANLTVVSFCSAHSGIKNRAQTPGWVRYKNGLPSEGKVA